MERLSPTTTANALIHIRASGPVSCMSVAEYLKQQDPRTTVFTAARNARRAIDELLKQNLISRYDPNIFRNGPTTYIARSLDRRCSPN